MATSLLASHHAKKFGAPIVIIRHPSVKVVSSKDYNAQHSIVYSDQYEYVSYRRVRFSLHHNRVVSFYRNSPPNIKHGSLDRSDSLETIDLNDVDDHGIVDNHYGV